MKKEKVIEVHGIKYLVTETTGHTRSGQQIRSCKWETYKEQPKLF